VCSISAHSLSCLTAGRVPSVCKALMMCCLAAKVFMSLPRRRIVLAIHVEATCEVPAGISQGVPLIRTRPLVQLRLAETFVFPVAENANLVFTRSLKRHEPATVARRTREAQARSQGVIHPGTHWPPKGRKGSTPSGSGVG
jgi:hypothetical protein